MNASPDGTRFATTIQDSSTGVSNIWIHDLQRNIRTRFTFATADRDAAVWSPDGRRIAFGGVAARGTQDLFIKDLNGGAEQLIYKDDRVKIPTCFSPDGKSLLFTSINFSGSSKDDVWILPLDGSGKARPLFQTDAIENSGVFSPDGRWIAYVSNESGRMETYVVPAPGNGGSGKWQLSAAGGVGGEWSRDGSEILYVSEDGKVFAVPFKADGASPVFGAQTLLFDLTQFTSGLLMPDHSRFIFGKPKSLNAPVQLVTNWPATIKK